MRARTCVHLLAVRVDWVRGGVGDDLVAADRSRLPRSGCQNREGYSVARQAQFSVPQPCGVGSWGCPAGHPAPQVERHQQQQRLRARTTPAPPPPARAGHGRRPYPGLVPPPTPLGLGAHALISGGAHVHLRSASSSFCDTDGPLRLCHLDWRGLGSSQARLRPRSALVC